MEITKGISADVGLLQVQTWYNLPVRYSWCHWSFRWQYGVAEATEWEIDEKRCVSTHVCENFMNFLDKIFMKVQVEILRRLHC